MEINQYVLISVSKTTVTFRRALVALKIKRNILCRESSSLFLSVLIPATLTRPFRRFQNATLQYLPFLAKSLSQTSINPKIYNFDQNFLHLNVIQFVSKLFLYISRKIKVNFLIFFLNHLYLVPQKTNPKMWDFRNYHRVEGHKVQVLLTNVPYRRYLYVKYEKFLENWQ